MKKETVYKIKTKKETHRLKDKQQESINKQMFDKIKKQRKPKLPQKQNES